MAHSADTGGPPDAEELYNLCKTTEKGLADIATGLGQIGAAPDAIKAVQQMGDVVGKICDSLAGSMKQQPAEPTHTIASATDAMMADHAAARQQAGPPA